MGAAAAAVHHVQPPRGKTAALHQGGYALNNLGVFQWLKAVEQRCNPCRIDHHHQQAKSYPYRPGPQPPGLACLLHEPQDERGQRQAEQGGKHCIFEQIGQPQRRGAGIEAKTCFQPEGAIPAQRQFEQPLQNGEPRKQAQLLQHRRTEAFQRKTMQDLQTAPHSPAQQQ